MMLFKPPASGPKSDVQLSVDDLLSITIAEVQARLLSGDIPALAAIVAAAQSPTKIARAEALHTLRCDLPRNNHVFNNVPFVKSNYIIEYGALSEAQVMEYLHQTNLTEDQINRLLASYSQVLLGSHLISALQMSIGGEFNSIDFMFLMPGKRGTASVETRDNKLFFCSVFDVKVRFPDNTELPAGVCYAEYELTHEGSILTGMKVSNDLLKRIALWDTTLTKETIRAEISQIKADDATLFWCKIKLR